MWHIRLIPTNLPPQNIWPISADRPNIWIFRFFVFFFPRNFCGIAFFSGEIFLNKILDTQNVSKNHENFLENNITSKSCLIKFFWVCTQKARKNSKFSIFRVLQFRVFLVKNSAFSRIIFFTFFHFSKENFPNFS